MTKIPSVVEVVEAIRQRHIHLKANNPVGFVHLFADIKKALTADRLALLQALYDELEGKKWIKAEVIASVSKNIDNRQNMYMEYHNEAIQDQQDNLQALMDKIRV